jgi:hypothetical protein
VQHAEALGLKGLLLLPMVSNNLKLAAVFSLQVHQQQWQFNGWL